MVESHESVGRHGDAHLLMLMLDASFHYGFGLLRPLCSGLGGGGSIYMPAIVRSRSKTMSLRSASYGRCPGIASEMNRSSASQRTS
jgi:hypothetical protein